MKKLVFIATLLSLVGLSVSCNRSGNETNPGATGAGSEPQMEQEGYNQNQDTRPVESMPSETDSAQ